MAKKTKQKPSKKPMKRKRVAWTKALEKELRNHSKTKTPVTKLAKIFKRTPAALRQKARMMGMPLGHRR